MVLITPRLVRPLDPDEVPPLPTFPGKFLTATSAPRWRAQAQWTRRCPPPRSHDATRLLIMRSMMNQRTVNGERGAILAQVAISMLMLMGFAAFVLDYGVVLVSRGQAQNSADAGALAGATARAFDDVTNPPPAGGVVELAATDVAQDNLVWNSAGSVGVRTHAPPVYPAAAASGLTCTGTGERAS